MNTDDMTQTTEPPRGSMLWALARNCTTRVGADGYIAGLRAAGLPHEFTVTVVRDQYAPFGCWFRVEPVTRVRLHDVDMIIAAHVFLSLLMDDAANHPV